MEESTTYSKKVRWDWQLLELFCFMQSEATCSSDCNRFFFFKLRRWNFVSCYIKKTSRLLCNLKPKTFSSLSNKGENLVVFTIKSASNNKQRDGNLRVSEKLFFSQIWVITLNRSPVHSSSYRRRVKMTASPKVLAFLQHTKLQWWWGNLSHLQPCF